ncbi:MAG: sugar transferase [Sedimentitalea sp.]|uniref:sugar transferase n=1 Tax=Sedimentitalea sp. TaxID=2048915 RepID=UPI00326601AB
MNKTIYCESTPSDASFETPSPKYRPKRLFDLAIVLVLLPVFSPLIALLWLIVKMDGGPGFFGHERIGRNGVPFRCWKIRSMVPNSEERLKDHLASDPEAAREWSESFKLRNDPRITPIGKFLRKSSLDELPQFWNVLLGEMSLVGPRPVSRDELQMYSINLKSYLSMSPGITGPWQVSGRNSLSYKQRVAIDVEYSRHADLKIDIQILAKTALVVLKRTGL